MDWISIATISKSTTTIKSNKFALRTDPDPVKEMKDYIKQQWRCKERTIKTLLTIKNPKTYCAQIEI